MANALKEAPLPKEGKVKKGELEKQYLEDAENYDPDRVYMFHLIEKNQERDKPVIDARTNRPAPYQEYKPFQNIVLSSMIIWEGQRRAIRYYDGCTTIFVDEQPKDKDTIDQLKANTTQRNFLNGKFGVPGNDKWLLLYCNICSWNGESPFRTEKAWAIFAPANSIRAAEKKDKKIDDMIEAVSLAKTASLTKMTIHGNYLGVPVIDHDSGNPLTEFEIRAAYKDMAASDPENFLRTYGNKDIEIKYYIEKALLDKTINNKANPNAATWGKNNNIICDISGLKSHDAIAERIFEFSKSEAGAEFLIQLKQLYN